jgi:hypothetical protein
VRGVPPGAIPKLLDITTKVLVAHSRPSPPRRTWRGGISRICIFCVVQGPDSHAGGVGIVTLCVLCVIYVLKRREVRNHVNARGRTPNTNNNPNLRVPPSSSFPVAWGVFYPAGTRPDRGRGEPLVPTLLLGGVVTGAP